MKLVQQFFYVLNMLKLRFGFLDFTIWALKALNLKTSVAEIFKHSNMYVGGELFDVWY